MRQPNPPSDHRKSRGEELRNIGEDLHEGPDGKPDPTPASLHSRHGKLLFVQLEDRLRLTIHLGMTGWLHYFQDIKDEPIHDRLLITFDNGNRLAYSDQRMFGRIGLAEDPHSLSREKSLGPDALDLNQLVRRTGVEPANVCTTGP